MASYEVRLFCPRSEARNVVTEVAKVFGANIRSYVCDPLLDGKYADERVIIFHVAQQQGDPDDVFEASYTIDGEVLDAMIDKVHQAVPTINEKHVIYH